MSRLPSGAHGAGGNRGSLGTGLGRKDAVHPIVLVMEGMVAEPLQNRPTPTLENPSRGNPGVDHPAIRIALAAPLGLDDRVVSLVLSRVDEATQT